MPINASYLSDTLDVFDWIFWFFCSRLSACFSFVVIHCHATFCLGSSMIMNLVSLLDSATPYGHLCHLGFSCFCLVLRCHLNWLLSYQGTSIYWLKCFFCEPTLLFLHLIINRSYLIASLFSEQAHFICNISWLCKSQKHTTSWLMPCGNLKLVYVCVCWCSATIFVRSSSR